MVKVRSHNVLLRLASSVQDSTIGFHGLCPVPQASGYGSRVSILIPMPQGRDSEGDLLGGRDLVMGGMKPSPRWSGQ